MNELKEAWNELRMLLVEKMLGVALNLAPNNKDGRRLAAYLAIYFATTIEARRSKS